MERLIHIYGLLAIVLITMLAGAVVYLFFLRKKDRKDAALGAVPEFNLKVDGSPPEPFPERGPEIVREETRDAIVFRDKDGYIINIIKK